MRRGGDRENHSKSLQLPQTEDLAQSEASCSVSPTLSVSPSAQVSVIIVSVLFALGLPLVLL